MVRIKGAGNCVVYIALLCAVMASATAQRRSVASIGATVGYERGTTTGLITVSPGSSDCGELGNGQIDKWQGGIRLDLPVLTWGLGASFGLAIHRQDIRFTSAVDTIWTAIERKDVAVPHEYHLDAGLTAVAVNALATVNVIDRLAIGMGASFAYRFTESFSQSDAIVGETTASFANGQHTQEMSGGERFTATPFDLDAIGGISYRLPFGSRLSIVGELTVRADMLSVVRESDWRSVSYGGGLALLFDLVQSLPDDVPAPPDIAPIDSSGIAADSALVRPSEVNAVRADIRFYSEDELGAHHDTAVAVVREVERQRRFPLTVLMAGSVSDPLGALSRLSRAETRLFAIDSLDTCQDAEVQGHLLNVIGARMQARRKAKLRLIESSATPELHATASAVRSYLHDVWGIAARRITIERGTSSSTADVCGDAHLVLASEATSILAPLMFQETDRSMKSPVIRLEPLYHVETGMQRWDLALLHGTRPIMQQSSDDDGGTRTTLDWRFLYDQPASDVPNVRAVFSVRDSAGVSDTARVAIPFWVSRLHWRVVRDILPCGSVRTTWIVPRQVWDSERGMDEFATVVVQSLRGVVEITANGDSVAVGKMSEVLQRKRSNVTVRHTPSTEGSMEEGVRSMSVVVFEE